MHPFQSRHVHTQALISERGSCVCVFSRLTVCAWVCGRVVVVVALKRICLHERVVFFLALVHRLSSGFARRGMTDRATTTTLAAKVCSCRHWHHEARHEDDDVFVCFSRFQRPSLPAVAHDDVHVDGKK